MKIDQADQAIIEQLQHDGRRPYTQIASLVGMSEAAVRQRVQRLVDAGVMQIVAVADPRLLGFERQALISIKVNGDSGEVAQKLAAIPQVEYVVLTAGSFDVLAEVVVKDDNALVDLVNHSIRTIAGVSAIETLVYLRIHKESYAWGRV